MTYDFDKDDRPNGNHTPPPPAIQQVLFPTDLQVAADPVQSGDDGDDGEEHRPSVPNKPALPDLSQPPRTILGYEVHPDANNFRMMKPDEFEALLADVKQSRQVRVPLELFEDKIIDGRNRGLVIEYLEALGLQFEYDFTIWEPAENESVLDRIISLNTHRRHESEDELLASACKCLPALLEQAEARKRDSRFTSDKNPRKTTVANANTPPSKRDSREKYLNSTPGILAKRFGLSANRARLALKLYKAIQEGKVPPEKLDDVLYGRCSLAAALPPEQQTRRPRKTAADSPPNVASTSDQPLASPQGVSGKSRDHQAPIGEDASRHSDPAARTPKADFIPGFHNGAGHPMNPSKLWGKPSPKTVPENEEPSEATSPAAATETEDDLEADINRRWKRLWDGIVKDHAVTDYARIREILGARLRESSGTSTPKPPRSRSGSKPQKSPATRS